MTHGRGWMSDLLASVQAAPPVKSVEVMERILKEKFSALDVSFMITDLGGNAVVRLTGFQDEIGEGEPERFALAGTLYERVIRSQQLWVDDGSRADAHEDRLAGDGEDRLAGDDEDRRAGDGDRGPEERGGDSGSAMQRTSHVVAPVSDRGDAIGLLELTLPGAPGREMLQRIAEAAHALAYVVIVNRRFTDLFEWGRRSTRMSLASEIQHRLLPESFTCDAGPFIVAGSLEPAAEIGGDTFDYALNRSGLHLSLTDAMGHDVRAAQLATVVVSALRNARRAGLDLVAQASAANVAVAEHAVQEHRAVVTESAKVQNALARHGAQAMATGQLMWVSFETGAATYVNAGHVWPLLLRGGRVREITPLVDLPFGVDPKHEYRLQTLDLRKGDRLVLITDGMLEPGGDPRSLSRLIEETATQHPRDAVRAFTRSVLHATGHDPRDDATVLCLEWSGAAWSDRDAPWDGHLQV
ncbi:PP2C family protein-serine/threonine phosphatase [Streptomyces ovatisporus]|uniref:PP2C family protein-serine/threonine phosphatase n=1 Tax=Streptomyces ovatisporus TaxID=1128682 RepID=A0ABV9A1M0_9ACTN